MASFCSRQKHDPNVDQSKFLPICPICSDFPLSEETMRKILTDEEYKVLRLKEDEPPNSHSYVTLNEPGNYHCRGCNVLLFAHDQKQTQSVSGLCEFIISADLNYCILLKEKDDKQAHTSQDDHANTQDSKHSAAHCEKCSSYLGFAETLPDEKVRLCVNGLSLQYYREGMADDLNRNNFPLKRTESEWEAKLGDVAYRVMRFADTEQAHRSKLTNEFRDGEYFCAGCDQLLFSSRNKFEATCGWPAFNKPVNDQVCGESFDYHRGFRRIEVHCKNCGGHVGHKFFDAPGQEGGTRYCINGCCLKFVLDQSN